MAGFQSTPVKGIMVEAVKPHSQERPGDTFYIRGQGGKNKKGLGFPG